MINEVCAQRPVDLKAFLMIYDLDAERRFEVKRCKAAQVQV